MTEVPAIAPKEMQTQDVIRPRLLPASVALLAILVAGCDLPTSHERYVPPPPPSAPYGVSALALDNAVSLAWYPNPEPNVDGYHIYRSEGWSGYQLVGTSWTESFLDNGASNGVTFSYAVSAITTEGVEGPLGSAVTPVTPRPEGFGASIFTDAADPRRSGFSFAWEIACPANDRRTDVYLATVNGLPVLGVWSGTELEDMGYAGSLDEITEAPTQGWSPTGNAVAVPGHLYIVRTVDSHYAKLRVVAVSSSSVMFDWAYQLQSDNPALTARPLPHHERHTVPIAEGVQWR